MKEPDDADRSDRRSEKFDEFEKRAQRILNRLDQADKIFDDLQAKKKKPDKIADALQEVFESIESGVKKMFSASSSQIAKPMDRQEHQRSISRENLANYLLSCSVEQLAAIRGEIDRILKESGAS